jgi:hypothetical protein
MTFAQTLDAPMATHNTRDEKFMITLRIDIERLRNPSARSIRKNQRWKIDLEDGWRRARLCPARDLPWDDCVKTEVVLV